MAKVRQVAQLKTWDDVKKFGEWCENSDYKALKGQCQCCAGTKFETDHTTADWWADKKPHSWFFAGINPHLSKIEDEDWYLSPQDTNLNESAHPFTNMHTGTKLSLLEAIARYLFIIQCSATSRSRRTYSAEELDRGQLSKIQIAEKNFVLPNTRNTVGHRMESNVRRRTSRHQAALARKEASDETEDLNKQISDLQATQKASKEELKNLRERKRALQAVSGVKRRCNPAKGKGMHQTADDVGLDPSEVASSDVASSEVMSSTRLLAMSSEVLVSAETATSSDLTPSTWADHLPHQSYLSEPLVSAYATPPVDFATWQPPNLVPNSFLYPAAGPSAPPYPPSFSGPSLSHYPSAVYTAGRSSWTGPSSHYSYQEPW